MRTLLVLLSAVILCSCADGGRNTGAQGEINVYSQRHYPVDEALFAVFTEETGIKVNVISAGADELISRLELEGADTPADLLFTADVGRLGRAKALGLLQGVSSDSLNVVPSPYRDPEGHWYGLTMRARVIVASKDRVPQGSIQAYEDLAAPAWKGKVVMRSSSNLYNQSLLASLIAANGQEGATQWTQGVVSNFAREPKGSDRDQTKSIAAGEGDLSVTNTYYIGHLLNSNNPEEVKAAEAVYVIFPNQDGRGTHVNVSGMGVTKHAKNKDNAVKLIEFLVRASSQKVFTDTNFEYPVRPDVTWSEPLLSWGVFKSDTLHLGELSRHQDAAIAIFDAAGWK